MDPPGGSIQSQPHQSRTHRIGQPLTGAIQAVDSSSFPRGLWLGPALAEPGCRDFKVSFMHASHALPCVYKTPLPLIYEWAGLTRGAEVVKHTLSSLDSAPQAQEGPTPRPRCSQMRAHRAASLPQVQPPSVLNCTTHTSRGLRCISESPTARVRRTRQVSSWSERREART